MEISYVKGRASGQYRGQFGRAILQQRLRWSHDNSFAFLHVLSNR
jgi:hypothetical protein